MSLDRAKRKLVEVALPLGDISAACKADKAVKTGTIRNLHKWFAPMPLPAWRALLFAALIDDPGDDEKRAYLLDVIKRLVANGAGIPDAAVVEEARRIIASQFPEGPPIVMDPFCGGGSTLVEAQRLGLRSFGSDLNPVPVLITRLLTEILPAVHGRQPLHPREARLLNEEEAHAVESVGSRLPLPPSPASTASSSGYDAVIRDVMHYGGLVRDKAWKALHENYPVAPGESPVAWLWARTMPCPNPACGVQTLLTTSWWLSKKVGNLAWIQPHVQGGGIVLDVVTNRREGSPPDPPKVGRGASFACVACNQIINESAVISAATSVGLGVRLIAVVAEVHGRRTYRAPTAQEETAAIECPVPDDTPDVSLGPVQRYISPPRFGLYTHSDLYTPRQLLTMSTFCDLVAQTFDDIKRDGGDEAWARTITTMLGLAVGRLAQYGSSQAFLFTRNGPSAAKAAFGRNDIPMTWDFVEVAPFGESIGGWMTLLTNMMRALAFAPTGEGRAVKADARAVNPPPEAGSALIATDPPYFDAIGYADLSDYFYVWHRRALRSLHPDLYGTVASPKSGELTAIATHHGGSRDAAQRHFVEGFTAAFSNLRNSLRDGLPMLVVYASKEQSGGVGEENRWSSILTAMVAADLEITGAWPIHGTTEARMISAGTNAVASYVVMVCRPRPETAGVCSLGDFNRALRRDLKPAVHDLQAAGILPVDLAQAAMGPGMQVYSRYRQVQDQGGQPVSVDQALRLINNALGEVLDEQEGELDPYSRFAVAWWEKHGWNPAAFGEADQLARPQGISVDDVVRAGVARYPRPGFVQLQGKGEISRSWQPSADNLPTAWEAVHHLADRLIDGGGSLEAGRLVAELGALRDPAQALVYRLHDIAAKKGRTDDQGRYNHLIGSWSDLLAVAATDRDGLF